MALVTDGWCHSLLALPSNYLPLIVHNKRSVWGKIKLIFRASYPTHPGPQPSVCAAGVKRGRVPVLCLQSQSRAEQLGLS